MMHDVEKCGFAYGVKGLTKGAKRNYTTPLRKPK